MRQRTRHRVANLICCVVPLAVCLAVIVWVAVVDSTPTERLTRSAIALAGVIVIVACLVYWPTQRRPERLYHYTITAAAEAATVERHADGTRTLALRAKRDGGPTFFFGRRVGSFGRAYNLNRDPQVCIELADIDYANVTVRRRWSGAYRLRGLIVASGRVEVLDDPEPGP